jgi:hypothetical protein
MERRKKQVGILVQIRAEYILGKDYGPGQGRESRIGTKGRARSRVVSKEYEGELRLQTRRSRSNRSRQFSRVKSSKHGELEKKGPQKSLIERVEDSPMALREESDYFVHFDPRKNGKRKESNLKEEDSTKSHQGRKSKVYQGSHL